MFGNEVVLFTLVSDEGDDVVEGNGGWQKGSENIFGIAISFETREHICLLP